MAFKVKAPGLVTSQRLKVPYWVDARNLAGGAAENYTVPAGIGFIAITGTTGFYINAQGAASAPADTTDGTASFYIPSSAEFNVDEGDVISIFTGAAAVITVAGYSV